MINIKSQKSKSSLSINDIKIDWLKTICFKIYIDHSFSNPLNELKFTNENDILGYL